MKLSILAGSFFISAVVASRSQSISQLEERVNGLFECEPENVINLLKESFRLGLSTPFKAILTICMTEIPYRDAQWGTLYSNVWETRDNTFLEALLEEGRCIEGELMEMFTRLITNTPNFHPYMSRPRMVLLRTHCRNNKVAIKGLVTAIRTKWGRQLHCTVKDTLNGWLSFASIMTPNWPYVNVLEETPLHQVRMASVIGTFSNKLHRYVKPVISDGRIFLKKYCIMHSLHSMSTLENGSSGTYELNDKLSIRTSGKMGVWIIRLDQDDSGVQMNVTSICDSIWGQEDCATLSIPLPKDNKSNLVVLMGMRPLLQDSSRLILQGSLQYSDISSFDENIRQWFDTLKVGNCPNIIASYIFHH